MHLDLGRVADCIERAAREELLPRLGALRADDVTSKASLLDPADIVTVADHAMERRLERELRAILPGSRVLGEEAAAADPSLLDLLDDGGPTWIVDPLDGTRAFASGSRDFGVLVALAAGGETLAGWIHLPAHGRSAAARAGGGVTLDGVTLDGARPADLVEARTRPLSGRVHARFMPEDLRQALLARDTGAVEVVLRPGCAAVDYWRLLTGALDVVVFHRLLPWDHAAGTLAVAEAGGRAAHPDGRAYRPDDREPLALITRDASRWEEARALLGL